MDEQSNMNGTEYIVTNTELVSWQDDPLSEDPLLVSELENQNVSFQDEQSRAEKDDASFSSMINLHGEENSVTREDFSEDTSSPRTRVDKKRKRYFGIEKWEQDLEVECEQKFHIVSDLNETATSTPAVTTDKRVSVQKTRRTEWSIEAMISLVECVQRLHRDNPAMLRLHLLHAAAGEIRQHGYRFTELQVQKKWYNLVSVCMQTKSAAPQTMVLMPLVKELLKDKFFRTTTITNTSQKKKSPQNKFRSSLFGDLKRVTRVSVSPKKRVILNIKKTNPKTPPPALLESPPKLDMTVNIDRLSAKKIEKLSGIKVNHKAFKIQPAKVHLERIEPSPGLEEQGRTTRLLARETRLTEPYYDANYRPGPRGKKHVNGNLSVQKLSLQNMTWLELEREKLKLEMEQVEVEKKRCQQDQERLLMEQERLEMERARGSDVAEMVHFLHQLFGKQGKKK